MEKQKTAMQELLDYIDKNYGVNYAATDIAHKAIELLELEKQQVVNAYDSGWDSGVDNGYQASEKYFNETFETKSLSIESPPHVVTFGVNESKPYDYGVTDNPNK